MPSDHTSVADIIQVLEEMKDGGAIQNYSVSQTTLDDVSIQVSGIGVPCCILTLNLVKQLDSTLLLLILFI